MVCIFPSFLFIVHSSFVLATSRLQWNYEPAKILFTFLIHTMQDDTTAVAWYDVSGSLWNVENGKEVDNNCIILMFCQTEEDTERTKNGMVFRIIIKCTVYNWYLWNSCPWNTVIPERICLSVITFIWQFFISSYDTLVAECILLHKSFVKLSCMGSAKCPWKARLRGILDTSFYSTVYSVKLYHQQFFLASERPYNKLIISHWCWIMSLKLYHLDSV